MTSTHSLCRAGLAVPESGDAQNRANGLGIKGQAEAERSNRTGDAATAQTRKDLADMAALAARAGCGLYLLASGRYLLTCRQMVRELPSLHAVGQLLDTLGARS